MSSGIFDTTLITSQPYRYFGVAAAVLPPLCIFGFGLLWPPREHAGHHVVARPNKILFGIAWLIITLFWLFSTLVASFNFTEFSLICYWTFSLLSVLLCVIWLAMYSRGNKFGSCQMLTLLLLFGFGMLVSCFEKPVNNSIANAVAGFTILPLVVWSSFALIISVMELGVTRHNDPELEDAAFHDL